MAKQSSQVVPPLDATTLNYMDSIFPERSPLVTDSEREVWMKAGERRAVVHMRNLLNKQEQSASVLIQAT